MLKMIIQVISSPSGGGAELLVREMQKIYTLKGVHSASIFLSGDSSKIRSSEEVVSKNPRSIRNVLKIRKKIKELSNELDENVIVHAHLTWPFFYVALASIGLRNVKLVYTEHNTTNKRRKIPFFWFIERWVYSRYSKIICISAGVHHALSIWIGPQLAKRCVTVPNGSRIYNFQRRSSLASRKPRLISVGSLTQKKNFRTAIKAVGLVRDQVESYEIVGEGVERPLLEALIRQEGLEDLIKLQGWSDVTEKYLANADIQLIPSLWEGFGLVAVEGMSTGLPVIASDVDGLREVLSLENPAVTLVRETEDPKAWAESIQNCIFTLRSQEPEILALASRSQAEKFTLNTMAESYLEVYSSLK